MNTDALINLWNLTQEHPGTSGARVATMVLLGLYNGPRFPMDLTELRHLDSNNLRDALLVIQSDASRCEMEIHEWLNRLTGKRDFGDRFESLAHDYKLKGRCRLDQLRPVSPPYVSIADAA